MLGQINPTICSGLHSRASNISTMMKSSGVNLLFRLERLRLALVLRCALLGR